ncbi:hypothetical protein FB45DRAFT_894192 [Roridomyces roridus]|uniref:Uncharacterized protein n=1 Tax=Roridomyces roridus TaxID=1738132 RepID=A0AAD7CI07_9AGAR|nr:hypothetical protein FB45DRAFT_894192 [Roridomyces roridus]
MLLSRQSRRVALQWRPSSSQAGEITPPREHPYLRYVNGRRPIVARTTDSIVSPLDAYAFIRAIERRFGRVSEFRFYRDSETRAYQFRAYLAFQDPEAYARVPTGSTLIQAVVPARPPGFEGIGLEQLENSGVLEPKDWQDGDLAEEVRTYYEYVEPKDGERVMRIHVEHSDKRFQTFKYVTPLHTKRFLPALAQIFSQWGGFAPKEPSTAFVTRSQAIFGDENVDHPAMRHVLQMWARPLEQVQMGARPLEQAGQSEQAEQAQQAERVPWEEREDPDEPLSATLGSFLDAIKETEVPKRKPKPPPPKVVEVVAEPGPSMPAPESQPPPPIELATEEDMRTVRATIRKDTIPKAESDRNLHLRSMPLSQQQAEQQTHTKQVKKHPPAPPKPSKTEPPPPDEPWIEVEERENGMQERLKKVLGGWF